jgi:hypothetical protein
VKKKLLILIIVISGLDCFAQSEQKTFILESRVHAGMNIPFYEALEYLINDDIYALDFTVSFPTYGKDYWEKLYNYPRTGIGYSYTSLGNNEVFGKAHSLYGYINIPLLKKPEKFSLNYQVSFGGAYITRIFDIDKNHLNRAIGSHTNIYIRLGVDAKIKITSHSEMIMEAGIMHFSNGKTRSPNYGINTGSLSLGFNYLFNNNNSTVQEPVIPLIEKKYVQSLLFSAGSKVYDNLLGKKYFVSSVSYNADRLLNHRRRLGLGADLFYDGSISEALADEDGTPEKEFTKLVRMGIHGSYSIRYKQLMMGIQIGHYIYSKYIVLTPVYSKISFQYLITNNISGGITVRSHLGKADCLEWGLGYSW